jgi:hypothetical protein
MEQDIGAEVLVRGRGLSICWLPYLGGFRKRGRLALNAQQVAESGAESQLNSVTDGRAMTVAMILFFMVGFLTCLNDIIIPHLKSIFELSYMQAIAGTVRLLFVVFCVFISGRSQRRLDWVQKDDGSRVDDHGCRRGRFYSCLLRG